MQPGERPSALGLYAGSGLTGPDGAAGGSPLRSSTKPASRNKYGGTRMANSTPGLEDPNGPRTQPEPPEQTQHPAGTEDQATKPGGKR
jgi:hypothetical protein